MNDRLTTTQSRASIRTIVGRAALVGVAAVGILSACTSNEAWTGVPGADSPTSSTPVPRASGATGLVRITDCADLADRAKARFSTALREGQEFEHHDEKRWSGVLASPSPSDRMEPNTTLESGAISGAGSEDFVGTNVQENGVDESDVVKTDGKRIVSVIGGTLRVTVLDGSPQVDGELELPQPASAPEMYLLDDRALVIDSTYPMTLPEPMPMDPGPMELRPDTATSSAEDVARPGYPGSQVRISTVDLGDPTSPILTGSTTVSGALAASREIDGTVRVVLRSGSAFGNEVFTPMDQEGAQRAIRSLKGTDLLPRVLGDDGTSRPLGSCEDVFVPAVEPAPELQSMITVLTINGSLDDLAPVSIRGSADTVYASTTSLTVGSSAWDRSGSRTDLHRFDLSTPGPARYTGSGSAPGTLLDQFSISERSGALRVVTTSDPTPGIQDAGRISTRLTILDTEGTSLDEIGHIDGLGIDETVRAVRFMDDLGYVVTFRQTDPLYALDLSDPRSPTLLGELKIPGFSQYMHPIGDGLIMGVGREADPETGSDRGLKVSLFDVSDPAAMAEVDRLVIPGATSTVGNDHRAFLWDAERRQAVLPVESLCTAMPGSPTGARCMPGGAAMVLGVEGSKLVERAELSHPGPNGPIAPVRSLIVGHDLWTVSQIGLGLSNAENPTTVQMIAF